MDYPQEPKVYPGERIPTIPDDSVPENQNQPEFKMPEYKKSIASFERYCNDKVVEADKFVEDHQAAQSIPSIRLNQGKGMIPRLEERFSKLEKRWDDVMDKFEGAEYDELEKRVMDMRSRVKKCKEKLTKVLGRFDEEEDLDEESDEEDLDEEFDEEEEDDAVRKDLEEEFDEEEEDDAVREDLEEEFDEEEESSDGDDDEDAFGELDSDPDSDEDDSDVEGAGLEKEPTGSEDDTEEMPSSDDTPDTDEEDDDDDDGELIGGDFNEEVSIIFVILLYY